ncbi:MAG: macro domain-containing protein [Lachnospiraceae bacterium]|nr:macro domain-containing protein [Lachnospiraceae bacterium]
MPFKIVRNDITKMQVDAIVNTANEEPIYSSGVDTAVYKAAGEKELLAARAEIGFLEEGEVAITPGFKLPSKYIIHAVSPYYLNGLQGEEEKLRSCYRKSLEIAYENQCKSIAFPLISTGSFRYPKDEGMRVAIDEIHAFLLKHEMMIYLVVFDAYATKLGKNLYPALESYIDSHYVEDKGQEEYGRRYFKNVLMQSSGVYAEMDLPDAELDDAELGEMGLDDADLAEADLPDADLSEMDLSVGMPQANRRESFSEPMPIPSVPQRKEAPEPFAPWDSMEDKSNVLEPWEFLEANESALKERMEHLSDTFVEYLMYLLKQKGLTGAQVYNRALISKQLFSKIKLNPQYHPDKSTAMRLCIGAGLNLDETKDLLARAGYALSPCDKRDIIFSFFIEHEVFDMFEIDIALENHGLPCFIDIK